MKEPWKDVEPDGDAPELPRADQIAEMMTKMSGGLFASMKKLTPLRPAFAFTVESLGTCIMRDDGAVFVLSGDGEWLQHSALPGTPAALRE